jgi:hypothetical protein
VGLALGFELVAQGGDGLILRGYERGAIRSQPVGKLVGIWSRFGHPYNALIAHQVG